VAICWNLLKALKTIITMTMVEILKTIVIFLKIGQSAGKLKVLG
jgi:uncharacterized membrane protein